MAHSIPGYTASIGYGGWLSAHHRQVICGILQLEGIQEMQLIDRIEAAELIGQRLVLRTRADEFVFEGLHEEVARALREGKPLVVQDLERGFEQELTVHCP